MASPLVARHARLAHEPSPPFPPAEYAHRLRAVRARMDEAGIDVLLSSNAANIAYLTGYDTAMPTGYAVLILPATGAPTLHCSELEAPCMLYTGNVADVRAYAWYAPGDAATQLAALLADGGYGGRAVGVEMGNADTFSCGALDARSFRTLERQLRGSRLVDATDLVLEARLVKSELELQHMRTAGAYTWAGIRAGIETIAAGVTDNDVIAAVYHGLVSAGSESPSIDPMIMAGERSGWMPHQAFRRHRLAEGDAIYFEVSGVHHRYNAPAQRSAVIGAPSDDVRRLAEASLAAVDALLEAIAPGRTGHEIAQLVAATTASVPDACRGGAYGYSIGLGMKPTWTEAAVYIAEGAHRPLEVGMTFHLPNSRWIPGRCGVGFSESVVVTERGCECLTPGEQRQLVSC